jgi:hypothetical protein
MRHHRLIAAAAVLCLLPASGAADDTIFDFVAPRADQVGNYEPGTGAVVTGGFGTLAPIAGWFDESWSYRLALTVDNAGGALSEWQLGLVVDAQTMPGADIFAFGQPTGADMRLVDNGVPVSLMSLGRWSLEDNLGRMWFQMPTIASGQTVLDVYFGNALAPAIDDPDGVFSYSAPYASRYALEPNAANTLLLLSAADANDYDVGGLTGTLQAGDLFPVPDTSWTEGQAVAADAPFDVGYFTDAATGAAPVAFARTLHSVVVNRGAENQYRMVAPFADAVVTVDVNGSTVDTVNLSAGVSGIHASDTANDATVTFTSTTPIMVSHRSDDPNDGYVLPPPASEVWGFASGTPRVHAVSVDTQITVYSSAQTSSTSTISAGSFVTLTAGGSGTANALRIVAVDSATQSMPVPITVVATADGDGGDGIVFHPESELGRRWVIPTDATFALIAATRPSTTCTLSPPMGADIIVTSASTEVPPFPTRIKFGADSGVNIDTGSVITCDNPAFAYYEDEATNDERNLFPDESHRKSNETPPVLTLMDALVTRYEVGNGSIIDTPDAIAPTAVTAWTDFRVAVAQPAETDIAYQLSIDDGTTYLVPFNNAWIEAADMTVGVTADDIRDNLASLDTSTGRVRVRVILRSTNGVAKPAVDSIRVFYEAAGVANRLVWDPVPDTVIAGTGFDVGVEAVDSDGNRITGLDGTLTISSSHSGSVIPDSVVMTGGRAAFNIKLLGTGDDVVLRADGPNGLVGISASFDLVAPDGATLEYISGSDQFGPIGSILGEPFVARVVDADGDPIGGVQVTFAVMEGGGVMMPDQAASIAVITDGDGLATAILRLGDSVGAQRVRAEAAGASVDFVARADEEGAEPPGGGCCRLADDAGSSRGSLVLALFVCLLLGRRRLVG